MCTLPGIPKISGIIVALARSRATGTAIAGCPYTTACSPNNMIFPGADAVNDGTELGNIKNYQYGQAIECDRDLDGGVR